MISALAKDLMCSSRIRETCAALGAEIKIGRTPQQLLAAGEATTLFLIDLEAGGDDLFEAISTLRGQHPNSAIICFGSHVDADRLKRAVMAGASDALPRSRFFGQLATLIKAASA
ncbi:MAG: hypothetical protein K1X83_02055 [Oligoflexia bacterium]|nr:hypothetical protein [Oligoflexia bacterium]